MVGGSAHLNGRTSVVVEYLRNIRVHLGQMRFGYGFGSALGREPTEQRAQSDARISFAESRRRSTKSTPNVRKS